ncbi:hypothetical protein GGF43_003316 [Coemansia sp. RSA 2618]|nr:hypothetical protein GGF43_003316 [Coemansia sp. RSA 2618]
MQVTLVLAAVAAVVGIVSATPTVDPNNHAANAKQDVPDLSTRGWDYYKYRRNNIPAQDLSARGWDYYKYRRSNIPAENLNERGWDYYKPCRDNILAQEANANNLNARGWDYYKW